LTLNEDRYIEQTAVAKLSKGTPMHLLEILAGLLGSTAAAYLVGRYPIHRTLRWKGQKATDGKDIAVTADGGETALSG
jgi:hypothetical protein